MTAKRNGQLPTTPLSEHEVARPPGFLDVDRVRPLLRSFSDATGIAAGLTLPGGETLIDTNWRRVCTDFHRLHPESRQRCIESDTTLANAIVGTKRAATYTCGNGLVDATAPVVVGGRHFANVCAGQFFVEEPDLERFRAQAARFGFDEGEYLEAIAEVPVLAVEKVHSTLAFLAATAELLASMGREALRKDVAQRKLQRSLSRLSRSVDAAVGTLARTVEMRDPYIAGHQERVSRLAVAIGKQLGLPAESTATLRIAALIHDLGKIAIPAEILTKPGKLSEAELALLRQHPNTAHKILREMGFPGPVARVIREHHERLDGSGYPRGLVGSQIKVESKILAVADVVEAMSARRPYRPAHGLETALAEIGAHRGRLYDSAAVDACLLLFHEEGFRF